MAKDVDLSSKEWCDIVFEGKNKDFGAYELRKQSYSRHNKAIIIVLIALAVVFGLMLFIKALPEADNKDILGAQDQQIQALVEDNKPDEPEEQKVEMEQPKALPEEVLNTIKVTELAIVPDEEVKKEDEIKSQDDLKETTTALGRTDFDKGTDDRNVVREHKDEIIVAEKPAEEQVFKAVEQMPQFPGGDAELGKWLSKNIQYPTMAQENNIQGRVIIQFVVTKTGAIGEVKVVRSVDRDLDNEARRLVKKLPNFIPGKMNGQPVNVWFTLPVNFKLQ